MNADALTAELKRRSVDEGFASIGIASAQPLDRDRVTLESWLRREHHAGMRWMERDPAQRADPGQLLEGCRHVGARGEAGEDALAPGQLARSSPRVLVADCQETVDLISAEQRQLRP